MEAPITGYPNIFSDSLFLYYFELLGNKETDLLISNFYYNFEYFASHYSTRYLALLKFIELAESKLGTEKLRQLICVLSLEKVFNLKILKAQNKNPALDDYLRILEC